MIYIYTITRITRMIVDLLFMIIFNQRLFPTAVTPTAVTPTAVILWNNFRWIWTILDYFGEKNRQLNCFRIILNCFGQYGTRLEHFENCRLFWTILEPFWTKFDNICAFWTILTIVDNLKPFQPIWTILRNFELFWTIFWPNLDHFVQSWTI